MAEKPLLMSLELVRATMAGLKTVTRRPVKFPEWFDGSEHNMHVTTCSIEIAFGDEWKEITPRFQPGDVAYVAEAWRTWREWDGLKPSEIPESQDIAYLADLSESEQKAWGRYRHARFMCRWMSRLRLKILDVLPERLQEITEEEAVAEGLGAYGHAEVGSALGALTGIMASDPNLSRRGFIQSLLGAGLWLGSDGKAEACTARAAYAHVYDKIYGPGAWEQDPWIWRYSYEVVR